MLLRGKNALVVGVASKHSIAWAVAQAWKAAGANVALTFQSERLRPNVAKLVSQWDEGKPSSSRTLIIPCNIDDEEELDKTIDSVGSAFGGRLDAVLHSVAYASAGAMKNPFLETSAQDFDIAHRISAYSLVALAKRTSVLLDGSGGGSMIALSYYGADKVIPNYRVMGPAKASLEACARQLAYELGPRNIRVNTISAGPLNTMAARGIPGFLDMLKHSAANSAMRRTVTHEEVANTALFLASDLSTGITGQNIYVDCGYSVMGMTKDS